MSELKQYKNQYEELKIKKNLKGKNALDAVKQYSDDLRYVSEQTEEICVEAINQNEDALQYVDSKFFK